jgi:hypothetical protein
LTHGESIRAHDAPATRHIVPVNLYSSWHFVSLQITQINMNTLRWILGTVSVLCGGGLLALFVVSNGFRRSFGASETNPLLVILPLAAMVVLFAGLVVPSNKVLLHVGAVAAVALVAFCIWQMVTESATVLWFALMYLALWFVFYASKAWGSPALTTTIP